MTESWQTVTEFYSSQRDEVTYYVKVTPDPKESSKNMITEHAVFRLIFGIDKWVLSNAKIP